MKTIKFKTNFKCQGCINTAKPYLEQLENIESWNVEDKKDHKELVITASDSLDKEDVKRAVSQAGYSAEEKNSGLLGKLFG